MHRLFSRAAAPARAAFALVLAVCALAACSVTQGVQPVPGAAQSLQGRASSPVAYVYVTGYKSNTVAQLAFDPKSSSPVRQIAPPHALPSTCNGADAIAVDAKHARAFVACYSGQIVPLSVDSRHALGASSLKPVAVPGPLYVAAPQTGTANRVYVTEYPGNLDAIAVGASSLSVLAKYPTGGKYPNEIAFYTAPGGGSTLYVAAPYRAMACGTIKGGSLLPFAQKANGTLTAQPPIAECGTAFNAIVAGNTLYWAGPATLGAYSIPSKQKVKLPTPPYASQRAGPPYYAYAMAAVIPPAGSASTSFVVTGTGSFINLYNLSGQPTAHVPDFNTNPQPGTACQGFPNGVTIGGARFSTVCWSIRGSSVEAWGALSNGSGSAILGTFPNLVTQPYAIALVPAS